MLICLYPPYYARCSQFFPFQHLQLSGLLQLEEGGINAEFVGAAVLEDGVDGGAFLVLSEVMEDTLGVEVFVVHGIGIYAPLPIDCANSLASNILSSIEQYVQLPYRPIEYISCCCNKSL